MPAPPLCSPPPQGMGGVGERAPWVTGIPWPAHAFSHGDFFGGRFPKGQSTAIDQHTSDSIPTQDKLVPKLKKKKSFSSAQAPGGTAQGSARGVHTLGHGAQQGLQVHHSGSRGLGVGSRSGTDTCDIQVVFTKAAGREGRPSHPTPPCRCTAGSVWTVTATSPSSRGAPRGSSSLNDVFRKTRS